MSVAAAIERTRFGPPLLGFGTLVLAIAAIELLIRLGAINQFVIPPPSEVFAAVPRIVAEEEVAARFADTASKAAIACVLIALIGIVAGVLLYKVHALRLALEDWVAAAAAAPTALTYPLFLVIFGRGATTIIVMAVIAGIIPVTLKTLEGLASTRRVFVNVGRSFNLTPWQQFRKVLFPAALPTIFVGVRLGLIVALINIVGMEYLISVGGLGELINELAERYDLAGTYASILFVILVSVSVFVATERIEIWLRRAG